jgi:murein L,D-transpeptidase YafK
MRKTISTVAVLTLLFVTNTSFFRAKFSKGTFYMVIDKSDYELHVYDEEGWLISYPVVFGNNDQGDKLMEGDRKTPEGTFRIVNKRVHEKWDRFMLIDYPTKESYDKFNKRKASGVIPKGAKIGGAIGIHGTWPHEDYAIDRYQNWTQGCISMKNEHVEQLYSMVPNGTKLIIRR